MPKKQKVLSFFDVHFSGAHFSPKLHGSFIKVSVDNFLLKEDFSKDKPSFFFFASECGLVENALHPFDGNIAVT